MPPVAVEISTNMNGATSSRGRSTLTMKPIYPFATATVND